MEKWTNESIENLISNQVQESLNLEYKRKESLNRDKKDEITKDVSSFANSDGGVLIYGVKEFDSKDKKHLPESRSPINFIDFNKEWLEQIINLITPKIEGVKITLIPISDDEGIYVIEIPKGDVAHQALNKKYYKRYNFMSVPMDDYEIRDVNSRAKHPNIVPVFILKTRIWHEKEIFTPSFSTSNFLKIPKVKRNTNLEIYANNIGQVYANFIVIKLSIPTGILAKERDKDLDEMSVFKMRNRFRDVTEYSSSAGGYSFPKAWSSYRFEPVLPYDTLYLDYIQIIDNLEGNKDQWIKWIVNVDNAPLRNGEVKICDIKTKIEDETKTNS